MYVRRLAKAGVRLISITQELGDDPAQVMMRQVIALFDEHPSKETAKHVLRAMKENARQRFYNGAPMSFGYTAVEVEKRGVRIKKRLAVDTVEAETVELIFRLYRHGDSSSGPLGVKATTCYLNERGYGTRAGARFGVATTHGILTNWVYIGEWVFNRRCSKTLAEKPKAEHISIAVPAIIDLAEFEAVQATLKAHNPRTTPAHVPGEMLTTDDVAGIDDVPLRHQVGLMLARNRSFKAQLDILKDVRNAPVLRIEGTAEGGVELRQSMPLANHLALTETEVEAVKDFFDARRMRARGLRDAEDASVETMDGRRLSDPGFLEALDKIVRSYEG